MITVRLYQRKAKKRADGKAPIFLVLSDGVKRKEISTGKYVDVALFDNESGLVKRGGENSLSLNAWLKKQVLDIDKIILDQSNDGKEITFESVEQLYRNNGSMDFIKFAREELAAQRGLISFKTFEQYHTCLNNLANYRPALPFSAITFSFLQEYKYYMATIKQRVANGYSHDFATIKKFWKLGVLKGYAKGNPFENFRIKTEEVVRNWLTKDELLRLHEVLDADDLSEAVNNSLRHFLFSCYTGIRFGDKLKMNELNIMEDRLILKMSKVSRQVIIPLNNRAKALLTDVLGRKMKQSNKRVNKDLKVAMEKAGIRKVITYHCSRHTFAVNSLLLGVNIIVVRDWLGHTSIKTTEMYLKIAQQFQDENMKKWDTF